MKMWTVRSAQKKRRGEQPPEPKAEEPEAVAEPPRREPPQGAQVRPQSASKRPPVLKPDFVEEQQAPVNPSVKGIILDKDESSEEEELVFNQDQA